MKKILRATILMIIFLGVFCITTTVQANSINAIDMDIYIDGSGNAEITEEWYCTANKDTEWYHSYSNLGESEITNLRVYDNIKTYETLEAWDIDASFSQKAYKCGINKVKNGVELCWGISNYSSNHYTIKYNISNFVSELSDYQMIYWTLLPKNSSYSIDEVKIKIHADRYFEDTIDVWGYGNYGGYCYVENGSIYMQTPEGSALGTDEYMTILAKFPLGTFSCKNVLDYDFNHYYEMSQKGSRAYNEKDESIIKILMALIPVGLITLIGAYSVKSKKFGFSYGKFGKKIPKDVAYYRDIPCDGDILKAYYIAYQYDLIKNKTDILGAIILKWLKKGIIRTESVTKGKVFSKEQTVIVLGKNSLTDSDGTNKFDSQHEEELFKMMYKASKDGILENKEFEVWCRNSYERVLYWFDDILQEQRNKLIQNNEITYEKGGIWMGKYTATEELKNSAITIAGLKRYLKDYTLIHDREAIEVELFENYLIFAQMLGIAKQVAKQFKELYPEMIEQTNYNSYDNIIYINYCASRGISSANSAKAAAQNYSSGGGGFSSFGGGGGSFGGGGRNRIKINK